MVTSRFNNTHMVSLYHCQRYSAPGQSCILRLHSYKEYHEMVLAIVILGVIVLLVAVFAAMYNGLVRLNVRANEAWSDITVQLKRRADLIPNLVNTVKGYATHESKVFEDVTAARAATINAQSPAEAAKAEG